MIQSRGHVGERKEERGGSFLLYTPPPPPRPPAPAQAGTMSSVVPFLSCYPCGVTIASYYEYVEETR